MTTTAQEDAKPRQYLPYLAVVLALSTPLIQVAMRPVWEAFAFPWDRFLSLWPFWIVGGVVLYYSVRIEGIPLSTFGIGKNARSLRYRLIEMIAALLMALVVAFVLISFSQAVRNFLNQPSETLAINLENVLPFWVTLPAWITAAFMEEVLFRSYPIERLTLLTGRRWLAALVSAVLFAVLHVFGWDWIHVITLVLPGSLLLTGLYLWRGSLWFVVVIHATINIPILLLPFIAPYM